MKQIKFRIITGLISLLFIAACFLNNGLTVSATSTSDSLHTQTKIYSSNNDDYFDGCEDYDDYVDFSPTITVLTHGLGAEAFHWSNVYSVENGEKLAYNSSSLINKIYENLGGRMTLYVASGVDKDEGPEYDFDFNLYKYSYADYVNATGGTITSVLDDVSKHIVIVFDSIVPDESNDTVYTEFHNILDNISAQYKNLTGVLPRFNLVGHSRGGITNIMYATEHPYNVHSIFSIGTPYSGSTLGEIDYLLYFMDYANVKTDEATGEETYEVVNEGVRSIMDDAEMRGIRDAWNSACTADVDINVVAYGSMTSIHLLRALIEDIDANYTSYVGDYGTVINDYSDLINTIINVCDIRPDLAICTLVFIDGLAGVCDAFEVNLYDDWLTTIISSYLEGTTTYEEASTVVGLVNIIDDEIVIMDDLFVDLNSQLGYGFEDGISYNGFDRYTKIFGAADYTDNRAISGQPGIVHNLETMNETYTNHIANSLDLGTPVCTITHVYTYNYEQYSSTQHKAYCVCGEFILQEHIIYNGLCNSCGLSHTHEYTEWEYYSKSLHIEKCICGEIGTVKKAHAVRITDVGRYKQCVDCGYMVDTFNDMNQIESIGNMISVNGSYIGPNGIIVLVDADVEAYLNGELVFYKDNDDLETS